MTESQNPESSKNVAESSLSENVEDIVTPKNEYVENKMLFYTLLKIFFPFKACSKHLVIVSWLFF